MRRTRWLTLALIVGVVCWVGATYIKNKASYERNSPIPPPPLEDGVNARSSGWTYVKSNGACPIVKIHADRFREIKHPSVEQIEGVDLKLYNKDCTEYEWVKSAKAQFDETAKTLYSDGQVDIDLHVPVDGPQRGHKVKIHTSGVTFGSDTGKVTTDRKTLFDFDEGGGSATGADYDPQTGELHLRSHVSLDWRGQTAQSAPMHIEAGEAFYKERESKVILQPWSKLTRDTLQMQGGTAVVTLDDAGDIEEAEVQHGSGIRDDADRKVEFAADNLKLHFGDAMIVDRIQGDGSGKLVSTATGMRTTVTANRLDLSFDTAHKDSTLSAAVATGSGVAEAVPLPKPGAETGETRVLRSDTIRLKMKPGGRDIDSVETAGPGTLDFLPNQPSQPKRWMKGDRIWIAYGADNRIQSLRSINVSTRTDKPPQPDQPQPAPAITQSKELTAKFDANTSDLTQLEQKTDFRYQEGVRHARAERAILEQNKNLMTLDGAARVWDPTGSAAADRIVLNQKSGDFTADGHVASTHQPDRNGKSSAMLATDEVMQARAQHMSSTDDNQKIEYQGHAVAWQGANRVEADRLDIDRDDQIMQAHGHVKSQFVDKAKDGAKPSPPIFTIVTAPDLVYTEETRIAEYSGGVVMKRPELTVRANKIRSYLKQADQDSSLDKAFADGTVKIVSTSEKLRRTRTGTSAHAEYYADQNKVILTGGEPMLVDSLKGQTRGKQLTWFSNDDRLIVDGADAQNPAKSILRKAKK